MSRNTSPGNGQTLPAPVTIACTLPLIGRVTLTAAPLDRSEIWGLCELDLQPGEKWAGALPCDSPDVPLPARIVLDRARNQLTAYLEGSLQTFDIPLLLEGTLFQKLVWQALCRIPFGEVRSYGEIAAELGRPGAGRAVGNANHANPLPILVPCHRVVAANGRLGGYSLGLALKTTLLELEGLAVQGDRVLRARDRA